ncbi:hypothetical protein NGR_b09930 (plasmid) [Sinorhizobium fredii NGR234]|uniref:Uncharacterized protein n=1 Tax=Sinorhizobium fredii (strain NBRC 101917 / NGR234) TaxID=394 RepID=C3KQT8_SINFN|nr:hypothetical protein NGR_b09930 [Sinorhizobium fredii NGR234]
MVLGNRAASRQAVPIGRLRAIGRRVLNFEGSDLERLFPLGRSVRQTSPRPEYRLTCLETTASLSYFVLGAAIDSPGVGVFVVTQHAKTVRPGEQIARLRIPGKLRMPIGNFVLSAAGEMLDLDAAILTRPGDDSDQRRL